MEMKDRKKAEAIAEERFRLIAPLVGTDADEAMLIKRRMEISQEAGVSERTLRRYVASYFKDGFKGLMPKGKGPAERANATVPGHVLEAAIRLRKELPSRSVAQIIRILELEGLIEEGSVPRSTLQDRLSASGYSSRQMRLYSDPSVAARRFQKRRRNQLWHADIKNGPYLPTGRKGEAKATYLVAFIDDATRHVVNAAFYDESGQEIVEHCFRVAIHKRGVPEAVYFDNGKQFKNNQMPKICAKLGVRLIYTKPYSPESKGKIERFNQEVGRFLAEAALDRVRELEELNSKFADWLEVCYQSRPHSGLGGKTPNEAYEGDPTQLNMMPSDEVRRCFLHTEERRVDKSGCISFHSTKYEVGLAFIGCKVDVIYDPADDATLMAGYPGHEPWLVRKLEIGEHAGKRPKLPKAMEKAAPDGSRLLKAAEAEGRKLKEGYLYAVDYRRMEGGESDG